MIFKLLWFYKQVMKKEEIWLAQGKSIGLIKEGFVSNILQKLLIEKKWNLTFGKEHLSKVDICKFCKSEVKTVTIFAKNLMNRALSAWKVSKCGVFSGPYFPAFGLNTERFPHSDWIWRDTNYLSYSVRMRKNTDQKKLRIGTHFTQCLNMLVRIRNSVEVLDYDFRLSHSEFYL